MVTLRIKIRKITDLFNDFYFSCIIHMMSSSTVNQIVLTMLHLKKKYEKVRLK